MIKVKTIRYIVLFFIICFFQQNLSFSQVKGGEFKLGVSSNFTQLGNNAGIGVLGFRSTKISYQGFDGLKEETINTYGINLSPKFGYCFWANAMAGLDLSLFYENSLENDLGYDVMKVGGGAGIFVRGYLVNVKKVNLFIEFNSAIGYLEYDTNIQISKESSAYLNIGLTPGISIKLGEKVYFDTSIGYNFYRDMKSYDGYLSSIGKKTHAITLEFGIIATIGR